MKHGRNRARRTLGRAGRRALVHLGLVLAILGLSASAVVSTGIRLQHTGSLPRGLYREVAGAPARGAVGMWCLPHDVARVARERGYLGWGRCPGGVEPVGKIVLAAQGDTVRFTAAGVVLNGRAVPNSQPLVRDAAGRPLSPTPYGTHVLRPGEVWLWSPYTPRSFDSRYFGPVGTDAFVSLVRPVWTWGPARSGP